MTKSYESEDPHAVSPMLFVVPVLISIQMVIPWLTNKIVSLSVAISPKERALIDEIKSLRAEQRGISMMDEFAKHAKIERKIIKIKEELKKYGTERSAEKSKATRAFYLTFYGIIALVFLYVVINYGGKALVVLDPDWVYPLGWLISLPSWIPGAIGLPFWMATSRTFIKRIQSILT